MHNVMLKSKQVISGETEVASGVQQFCPLEQKATYLFLLLVEIVDDDTDEQVKGEEGAKDDEDYKVEVHVQVVLIFRLLLQLGKVKMLSSHAEESLDKHVSGSPLLTPLESTAAYMRVVQPLNVA